MTQYAVETRYPANYDPITREEYENAVQLAEAVVSWAEEIING